MRAQSSTRTIPRFLIYTLAALGGIVLAIMVIQLFRAESSTVQERSAASSSSPSPAGTALVNTGSGTLPARPQSLRAFVAQSDIMVVGTIGRIMREGTFYGYDATGQMLLSDPHPPAPVPVARGTTFVDYEILVEQVIRDDGTLQAGKPLMLRMPGKAGEGTVQNPDYPMSQSGDRHLLALTATPDRQAYGLYYGPWGRLNIQGAVVTYTDGDHTPIDFTDQRKPADFLQALRAAAHQQ